MRWQQYHLVSLEMFFSGGDEVPLLQAAISDIVLGDDVLISNELSIYTINIRASHSLTHNAYETK